MTEGDYEYVIIGDAATITKYRGKGGEVTVPSTLGGSKVTIIGDFAFEFCTGLTSIVLPSSVASIGKGAFNGCTGLTSINEPSSLTAMGYLVFNGCYRLKWPRSVEDGR